jgi:hypothetical protein
MISPFRFARAAAVAIAILPAFAHTATASESKMQHAATQFLSALGPELAAKAKYPFNSDERLNWYYVPIARKGVPLKEMNEAQQKAAMDLLKVGLSQKGIERTQTIRRLENVLKVIEQGKGPLRDPDNYFFTVFGEPSDTGAWGWRYEGHHCSLNFTVVGGRALASTPQFFGANPAEVREGPMKGTRVLAAEEDLGRALIKALTTDQQKQAIRSETAPADVLTNNQRKAEIQEDSGIPYSALTHEQQGMLLSLIQQHASLQAPDTAKKRIDSLRHAGLDKVKFAWMGGLEPGDKHYYRVQGVTFLIEYDNTQNNANHIHVVWRDFKGDWGADLLEKHYKSADHDHGHDDHHDH